MGLGYAKIITETSKLSFGNWLTFLKTEFFPYREGNGLLYNYINNEGDISQVSENNLLDLFESNGVIILNVENKYGEAINCTIQMASDNCYYFEEYGLDQLTSDASRHNVFEILQRRYLSLHREGVGIGFIYDKKGYSEDYISFRL
ncbi:MAG: hypothetical protein ACTHLE_15400 [Agriterribacter sp.]